MSEKRIVARARKHKSIDEVFEAFFEELGWEIVHFKHSADELPPETEIIVLSTGFGATDEEVDDDGTKSEIIEMPPVIGLRKLRKYHPGLPLALIGIAKSGFMVEWIGRYGGYGGGKQKISFNFITVDEVHRDSALLGLSDTVLIVGWIDINPTVASPEQRQLAAFLMSEHARRGRQLAPAT